MGMLPIRKVKPERVALTSYYGKVFVTRSERTVDDYAAWLAKRVIAATLDDKAGYTNAHYGDVHDSTANVPRGYSGIARRSAGFTYNHVAFSFDYGQREEVYGKDVVKKVESKGGVVCGKRGKTLIVMDETNVLWEHGTGAPRELGFIEAFLGITGKVPTDTANINIFGKPLPVGMVLAYTMGLTTLLKRLGTKYRIVQRGTRNELTPGEYAIVFKDVSLIISRSDAKSSIILSGFNTYTRQIKEVHMHQFDTPRTYNSVLARENLRPTRFLKELDLMQTMFIDHITLELLKEMKEPEGLDNLIIRACELLTTDDHAIEVDATQMRYRGYERMSGMVYTEMVSAIRKYKARPPGTGASIDLNPYAVAIAIQKDSSIALVEESNPIHNLKEMELVSHSGAGGRSSRTMNGESRLYHKSNIGTISEATVDSSKVAVNTLLSSDPKFTSLRGKTEQYDESTDTLNRVMSTSANISPFTDKDDAKRINFISIQHSSGVGSPAYQPMPVTTGYEKVLAHRTSDLYAYAADFAGEITAKEDTFIELTNKETKEVTTVETGLRHGVASGVSIPHQVICDRPQGYKFKIGEVLCFNDAFFVRDFFDKEQVQWKAGMMVNTVLLEAPETLEDSSSISSDVADALSTKTTSVRGISVGFGQSIRELLPVGTEVKEDTALCVLEDDVLADENSLDSDTLAILDSLAANTPKADSSGIIDKIEVIYFGDKADMSDTLKSVVNASDRIIAKRAKDLGGEEATTGQVKNTLRVAGLPLHQGNAIVKVFITKTYGAGTGDKAVFNHSLKTTFGNVLTGRNETESGIKIQAKTSQQGVDGRAVNSPALLGTANMLLKVRSKQIAENYFS